MALLVWLPLNGNLNNQGLSDVAVSNSGATVSDNGKIGKCYYFDGNNHFLQFNKSLTNLYTGDCSWALWVKPTDDTRGSLITEYASTGASNVALELYTNRRLRIYWNGSPDYFPQYSLTKDVWTHVAVTRHNNELRVYINGALIETKSDTTLAPRTSTSQIRIGDDYRGGSSVSYQGYLNDIRIYDHCLSPKEVKEISKGLVLHYKFDNLLDSLSNIVKDTTLSWVPLTAYTSSQKINDVYTITIGNLMGTYTYAASRMLIPLELLENSAHYVITFKYKVVSGEGLIDTDRCDWCDTLFTYKEDIIINDYHYIKLICPLKSYTTVFRFMDFRWTAPNTVFEISELQLQKLSDQCVDCSGYRNDGTTYGNVLYSKDTPRYLEAVNYTDSACAIGIGNLSSMVPEGLFTFNIWFKKITGEWSTKAWETLLGGPSGFELESKLNTTQNAYIHPYSWGGGSTTTPNAYSIAYDLDKWNMVTMVRDTSNTKFYLNGELKVTGVRASIPSGDYFIGAWKTATQQNYRGYLSDARIYATALSADDIKDLYNTSASIHNNASVDAFEFTEESSGDTQVTKTGIFEGKDFREISKNLFNKEEVAFNSGNYAIYGPNAFEMRPLIGKVCSKRSIPIKPDTYYVLSYDETQVTINLNAFNTVFWDITGTRKLTELTNNANGLVNKIKFKSPANAYFVSFSNYGTLTDAQQQTLVNTLQFEEGETWTEYQEHDITNAAIYEDKVEAKQIIET